jgi:hypothetical protein
MILNLSHQKYRNFIKEGAYVKTGDVLSKFLMIYSTLGQGFV